MRIGLDAKRAFQNYTGLGNYSRTLIRALLQYYPEEEYFLFTPRVTHAGFLEEMKQHKNVTIISPRKKYFSSLWRSYGITGMIKKLKLDVYHGLSNELPLNISKVSTKKIVTIHDLIPFKEDVFRNVFDDFFFGLKVKKAALNADRIIAVSQATAKDINNVLKVPELKISTIYPVVDLKDKTTSNSAGLLDKFQLPPVFILQVGRVEYRKNVQVVLDAMIELKNPSFHYVIVGKRSSFYKSLWAYAKNFRIDDKLHFIDQVTDEELDALYQACSLVIYPSLYEGFGLPVIEALVHHKPVLTTAGGCFEEAGGEGAYYTNTSDPVKVGEAIEKILDIGSEEKVEKGLQHIARFNAATAAASLMDCYKR